MNIRNEQSHYVTSFLPPISYAWRDYITNIYLMFSSVLIATATYHKMITEKYF
jgi:hypothetical protein